MELRVSQKSGLKLYNNLLEIKSTYHEQHKIRHPADTFKMSIEKLNVALGQFIERKKSHALDEFKEKAICNYICELDSFYDRLLLVMKGLTEPSEIDNRNADIWLKDNTSKFYTQFKDSTSKSHKMIRDMANVIKHDTHTICYLTVTDHKGRQVEGFYFSNIIGKNDLQGPCPKIHEEYLGASTAISYDFFLRYSLGFVSLCIFHLNRIFFKGSKPERVNFQPILDFFNSQINVGNSILPNEYSKPTGLISKDKLSFVVKFPHKEPKNADVDKIHGVQPFFKINQRTGSSHAKFPYMQLLS
ncbi:hypothetical protein [Pseudoalteromonas sp. MMG007]|uniref:hypothetical protein n=1 Tax=Pseudoalteromonas sp. MMG007 TaxID=2822684 RepID=UPI001B382437|nr:hypothetical protein [Pseudoalteromonas sp. MMG007]MBQ4858096.1 hypothetical protein [Pseudoalteromonas sp. MMG007]